jgi:hypothetical protein
MNYTVIGLGIVLVILIYALYVFLTDKTTRLSKYTSLTSTNTPITSISDPTATNYAYGIWVYVNTWDSTIQKYIYARQKNIGLRLDTTTPSLFCDFYMNNGNINTITVTDSFPIQKWVYVIISVNTQFIDCYLDGKLMNSTKLSSLPIKPPDESVPLILGGSITGATQKSDISVANFYQFSKPVDPEMAWKYYMKGNGQSQLSKLGNYNANLAVLKNNVMYSNIKLF